MEKNVQVLGIKASLRKKGEGLIKVGKNGRCWEFCVVFSSHRLLGELHEMMDVKCLYLPGNMGLINAS